MNERQVVTRQLIVVDIETTGLDPKLYAVLEVAAVNVETGEELYFVPSLPMHAIENADPEAMAINRYFERRLPAKRLDDNGTIQAWQSLSKMLKGNTFAGMNPTFDLKFVECHAAQTWHYAPADVGAYVAGAIGMHPARVPHLSDLCDRMGVEIDPHGALEDARATAELYRRAMRLKNVEL